MQTDGQRLKSNMKGQFGKLTQLCEKHVAGPLRAWYNKSSLTSEEGTRIAEEGEGKKKKKVGSIIDHFFLSQSERKSPQKQTSTASFGLWQYNVSLSSRTN